MRRETSVPATIFAILLCVVLSTTHSKAGPTMVVDVETGKVLEHKDAFQRWYPASLTKLMTAYVVFRQVKSGAITVNSPVTISNNAAKAPPSKMYFKPGSQLTLDHALKIIMVKSANDVSVAIAETIAGSHDFFVAMMNEEAAPPRDVRHALHQRERPAGQGAAHHRPRHGHPRCRTEA